jgi:hypothetical protein
MHVCRQNMAVQSAVGFCMRFTDHTGVVMHITRMKEVV